MIKYVKEKSGIEKPVWVDPLFPAFRGLLDAVLRKVKVQSKSNQCAGGFIERTTREATLYEQAATTYLLKTLHPMSLELEAARKKSAAPMMEHKAETISTTEEARNARRAAEQQAQAAAEKEAAEEKAAEMESSMQLSISRAQVVQSALLERGVPQTAIATVLGLSTYPSPLRSYNEEQNRAVYIVDTSKALAQTLLSIGTVAS